MTTREHVPRWAYAPAIVGLAVVVVPLLSLLPKVHWATFIDDITEPATASALLLSTKSAVVAVAVCVIIGVPLALVIARAPRGVAVVLRTTVTLPLVLPPLVGGVALLAVLGRTGIIGPWLERAGIAVPFTPAAVIVAQTFVAMPFLVIAVEGALRSAGIDYERVAAGLGAGRSRILTRVTLPLILPGLLAGIVLAFARSVGEFGATALLAGNKPGVTQTIPMAIYTAYNGVGTSRQAAMALSVLLIATALAVLLLFPAARGSSPRSSAGDQQATVPVAGGDHRGLPDGPAENRGQDLQFDLRFDRPGFSLEAALELPAGQVLAIVGPNAAGKSTLLNLIAGNLRPHRGTVSIGGREVSSQSGGSPRRERPVGVLSQQPLLFPHMSVLENVAFGPRSQGVSASEARNRARELLANVGMAGTDRRRPAALSGGQQQRVALARALATRPAVLLLDEPLAAMDVSTAPSIRRTLAREIARTGVTAVVVTHDLLDVVGLARRVAVIEGGRVVEEAPTADFLARPTSAFGSAFTGVNALADPASGELLHLRDDELEIRLDGGAGWEGTVHLVDAAGAGALVKVAIGGDYATVAAGLEEAGSLLPGQRVWITPKVEVRET